jgi:uncharacterized protein (TIGR02996 family)
MSDLLAAILANPEEDAPRLAYAAALPADDPRAEFIRLQFIERDLRQKALPHDRKTTERAGQLLTAHPEWIPSAFKGVSRSVELRRGFVEWATIDAPTWLARGSELLAAAPLLGLRLRGELALELWRSTTFANIAALDLSDGRIGDVGLRALASSPYLPRLRWLALDHNDLTDAGVEALAESRSLPLLRRVSLARNRVVDPAEKQVWLDDNYFVWEVHERTEELVKKHGDRAWFHLKLPSPVDLDQVM